MTAIIRTGTPSASQLVIPASIVTLENLLSWSLRANYEMFKNSDFYPDKDLPPVRRIQRSPFVNGAGNATILWSLYLTYDSNIGIDPALKDWTATDEITTSVPSPFFNS